MIYTDSHILVIFGASGDLTKRKLIPALLKLYAQKLLPDNFAVLGVGRTKMDDNEFRTKLNSDLINLDVKTSSDFENSSFLKLLHYIAIDTENLSDYAALREKVVDLSTHYQIKNNCIFYLATPPSMYEKIAANLSFHGMNNSNMGWKRIIIEKPFGSDFKSAQHLNKSLLNYFAEEQIYRIDHYLGKETVQNLLVTRFSNGIFEPLWNRNFIHHVEITAAESLGVANRAGYYDQSGALRDMIQNHLLQLLAMVAMEPPINIEANSIRNEALKVFQSLRPLTPETIPNQVIRGQYTSSIIKGQHQEGYREHKDINAQSRTETFVAIKTYIDNWRWSGVPFYIRTGKMLPTRVSEVVIHFHNNPHHIFINDQIITNQSNQLVIRIQPDEGILLKFGMKVPGAGFQVQPVNMDFHYTDIKQGHIPEAYERLLLDCMQGDPTLYARGDAVEASWNYVQPIIDAWESNPKIPIFGYPAGSWGPEVSDNLIEGENLTWRYPCKNLSNDGEYCEL